MFFLFWELLIIGDANHYDIIWMEGVLKVADIAAEEEDDGEEFLGGVEMMCESEGGGLSWKTCGIWFLEFNKVLLLC